MRCKLSISVIVMLGWTTLVPAQEPSLKLIPHDAGAALLVRNLKELKKEGNRAAVKIGRGDLDVAKLMTEVVKYAGLQDVMDETNSSGIMAVSTKSIGEPPLERILDFRTLQLLVIIIPFK